MYTVSNYKHLVDTILMLAYHNVLINDRSHINCDIIHYRSANDYHLCINTEPSPVTNAIKLYIRPHFAPSPFNTQRLLLFGDAKLISSLHESTIKDLDLNHYAWPARISITNGEFEIAISDASINQMLQQNNQKY